MNRDKLVTELTKLVNWAEEVIQSNDSKLILHLGI